MWLCELAPLSPFQPGWTQALPVRRGVSNRALITLTDAVRRTRNQRGTRWRQLSVGRQALLVLAHLRKGETYTDLAVGFDTGTTTVFRYIHEAIEALAVLAPTLAQAIEVSVGKAFVTLDGTMLRIDRVGMASGRDRPFFSSSMSRSSTLAPAVCSRRVMAVPMTDAAPVIRATLPVMAGTLELARHREHTLRVAVAVRDGHFCGQASGGSGVRSSVTSGAASSLLIALPVSSAWMNRWMSSDGGVFAT